MSLIDDNQVETSNGKRFLVGVDIVNHRLIGGERDTCRGVGVLVLTQNRSGHVGQQLHKVLVCLTDQRNSISEEQHVLHPSVAGEHIHQRDSNTRFSCACSHHQQTSAVLAVEMLTHGLDSHFLIVTVGDTVLHAEIIDIASLPFLYQQLQIAFGMEGIQSARRIAQTINDVGLKTIGVVDDRSCAISFFQAIGIQFRLVLALDGGNACSLGFDNCQGQTVAAKEHIVAKAFTLIVRHPLHLHFDACLRRLYGAFIVQHVPPCFLQHQVDI